MGGHSHASRGEATILILLSAFGTAHESPPMADMFRSSDGTRLALTRNAAGTHSAMGVSALP